MHDIQAICPRALLFCIWFLVVKCVFFSNFRWLGRLGAIIVLALCGSICLLNVSISKCVVDLDHSKELCEDCIWNKEWSLNEVPDAFRISVHRIYCGTLKSFLLASLDFTCYRTHWRICVSLCGAHRPAYQLPLSCYTNKGLHFNWIMSEMHWKLWMDWFPEF